MIWEPLQIAIVSLITSDTEFYNLTNRKRKDSSTVDTGAQYYVSYIPDYAVYPYVETPGDAVSRPFYEFEGGKQEEPIWPFHIWSDLESGGPLVCVRIADVIDNILTTKDLSVTGWTTMKCQLIYSTQPMREEGNPNIYHMVMRYHLMLDKT
jgi:hypothetical protein